MELFLLVETGHDIEVSLHHSHHHTNYGPSVARFTYFPDESKNVTLDEILNGTELYVEYVNEDGFHYEVSSGSFALPNGAIVESSGSTEIVDYGFNRAWLNRMDLDETIVIDNSYPSDFGKEFSPANKKPLGYYA